MQLFHPLCNYMPNLQMENELIEGNNISKCSLIQHFLLYGSFMQSYSRIPPPPLIHKSIHTSCAKSKSVHLWVTVRALWNRKVTHHCTKQPTTLTLSHTLTHIHINIHTQDGLADGDSVDATVHPLGINGEAAAESWLTDNATCLEHLQLRIRSTCLPPTRAICFDFDSVAEWLADTISPSVSDFALSLSFRTEEGAELFKWVTL